MNLLLGNAGLVFYALYLVELIFYTGYVIYQIIVTCVTTA